MIIALLVFISFVSIYAVIVRPWLRKKPWMQWFFANPWVEWVEIHLFKKSETILVARAFQVLGIVGSVSGYLGTIDYSIFALVVPEHWQPFLPLLPTVFNGIGTLMSALRRDTTQPLAVVSLPQVVSPEVAVAVENFEAAKIEAVAVVKKEEAEAAVLPPTVGERP